MPFTFEDQAEAARAAEMQAAFRSHMKPRRRHIFSEVEPLGMPPGSVRSIITLLALVAYIAAAGYSMVSKTPIPESLSSIVITIIAFYFGTRAGGRETITEIEGNQIQAANVQTADAVQGSKTNNNLQA